MTTTLSVRSEKNLAGVHPKLVAVVRRAFGLLQGQELSFIVTEGVRTVERQQTLVRNGASRTLNSKHIPDSSGFGHAVDLAATIAGNVSWDWPLYARLASAMKQAAQTEGVQLTWGGDWKTFPDGPHFEIPPGLYK